MRLGDCHNVLLYHCLAVRFALVCSLDCFPFLRSCLLLFDISTHSLSFAPPLFDAAVPPFTCLSFSVPFNLFSRTCVHAEAFYPPRTIDEKPKGPYSASPSPWGLQERTRKQLESCHVLKRAVVRGANLLGSRMIARSYL